LGPGRQDVAPGVAVAAADAVVAAAAVAVVVAAEHQSILPPPQRFPRGKTPASWADLSETTIYVLNKRNSMFLHSLKKCFVWL
jgi:hypothetical protein